MGLITKASYEYGQPWLDEVLEYIESNYNYLVKNLSEKIVVSKLEGTYLIWLNCRALNLSDKDLKCLFTEKCKILVNCGADFGTGGNGFVRMNIACPYFYVKEAVSRINAQT